MRKDGQANQMAFSFSKPFEKKSISTTKNVICFDDARSNLEASRVRNKENEVISKIIRASKSLTW